MTTVICGSTAYPDLLAQAAQKYPGAIVPDPDDARGSGVLNELWLSLVSVASLVVVVRKPDGSLGSQTTEELVRAIEHGRPVEFFGGER